MATCDGCGKEVEEVTIISMCGVEGDFCNQCLEREE